MAGTSQMRASNAVYGSKAQCYVTIGNRRYNFLHLTEFESEYTINTQQVPILGKVGFGNKAAGGVGEWSATVHYNQSIFRVMADEYQKTGGLPYFEIQVTNDDVAAGVGRQTVMHHGCLISGSIPLAKILAGDQLLSEGISGTFESWDLPEKFNEIEGL